MEADDLKVSVRCLKAILRCALPTLRRMGSTTPSCFMRVPSSTGGTDTAPAWRVA